MPWRRRRVNRGSDTSASSQKFNETERRRSKYATHAPHFQLTRDKLISISFKLNSHQATPKTRKLLPASYKMVAAKEEVSSEQSRETGVWSF